MQTEQAGKKPSRTGYNVANWEYIVPTMPTGVNLYNDQERGSWLSNLMSQIVAALPGFARLKGVTIKTNSSDDNKFSAREPNEKDLSEAYEYLRITANAARITIWFDLDCILTQAGLTKTVMPGWDGWLWITNNIQQGESADPDDGLIELRFEFHNFIFSPETLSDEYLNQAKLNAAPLQAFLRRLEQNPALILREVSYNPDYRKWLEQHHFL